MWYSISFFSFCLFIIFFFLFLVLVLRIFIHSCSCCCSCACLFGGSWLLFVEFSFPSPVEDRSHLAIVLFVCALLRPSLFSFLFSSSLACCSFYFSLVISFTCHPLHLPIPTQQPPALIYHTFLAPSSTNPEADANIVRQPNSPQRGSFPLDHDAECQPIMKQYLRCLRAHRGVNDDECRMLSKNYLVCRMERCGPFFFSPFFLFPFLFPFFVFPFFLFPFVLCPFLFPSSFPFLPLARRVVELTDHHSEQKSHGPRRNEKPRFRI